MDGYLDILDTPSPILLQYATLGVHPKVKSRPPPKKPLLARFKRPYQFICRLAGQRARKSPWPKVLHEGVAPDAVVVHNVGEPGANLSDVFEVISETDPTFGAGAAECPQPDTMAQAPAPYAFILEQPAPKALRFRYECEGRSAGSIPGVNSSTDKTFPTIKICGYKGCMVIVVSCVTKEEPYKPHPHNLVGRDCQMGVCTVKVKTEGDADSCQVQFRNLGIQCVKRRDIADALRVRQELRVNPFKTGYAHRSQPQSIDLNAVRLCFQVFLTDDAYKVQRALQPVVSEVIYDKKAMSDLLIVRASHCSGPVKGGTTLILLCEKVTREDTEVWFFREENGLVVWSERGHIEFVHKQLAIVLKTPPYRELHTLDHVTVQLQLQRLSDGAKSNTFTFEYIPEVQDKDTILMRKKPKKLSYNLQEYNDRLLSELPIKAEPNRTPPHPMLNPAYPDQQWQAESHMYAAQLAWASPPYASPSVCSVPDAHPQVLSPDMHAQAPSPAQVAHALSPRPAPPYGVHAHAHMQQQPAPMHMQNLQVRSPLQPHVSPAQSPILMHSNMPGMPGSMQANMQGSMQANMQGSMQANMQGSMQANMQASMQGSMQAGMCMPTTMDPVMAEVVQPTYTQMDATANNSTSLTALLMNQCDEDVQFNSGDLSNLSSMLNERGDLSDSLNRLSTRDLLQP